MKKNYKNIWVKGFLLIILSLLLLTGCSSEDDPDNLSQKAEQEISYLDTEIIKNINALNNISVANYKVTTTDIGMGSSHLEGKGGESQSETEGSKKSSETGLGSESESSSSSGSESSSSGSSSGGSKKQEKSSQMTPDTILNSNRDVNWKSFKNNIESIYSSWSVIVLDLYKLGVNNDDVLAFSTELDNLIVNAKSEDKQKCIASLAKMYEYLPNYLDKYSKNNDMISLVKTKSSILNAYSFVEQDNWQMVQSQLSQADANYMPLINSVSEKQNKIYNVNKSYILLKELQNSISSQDKDVFYIKYKSLIEELNILQEKSK